MIRTIWFTRSALRTFGLLSFVFNTLIVSAQWQELDLATTEDLWSVHYRSDGNVWIAQNDSMYYSLNNGDTFVRKAMIATDLGNAPIIGAFTVLHAYGPTEAILTGTYGSAITEAIWRTTTAGNGFTLQHNEDIGPIDAMIDGEFAQAPIAIVVGTNGRILRSTDSGVSWNAIPSGVANSLHSVEWMGGSTYLAAGFNGLLRSLNGGLSWSTVPGAPTLERVEAGGGVCYGRTSTGALWKSARACSGPPQAAPTGNSSCCPVMRSCAHSAFEISNRASRWARTATSYARAMRVALPYRWPGCKPLPPLVQACPSPY